MLLIGIIILETVALLWVSDLASELLLLRTLELLWLLLILRHFKQLPTIHMVMPDRHALKVFLLIAILSTLLAVSLYVGDAIPITMLSLPAGIISPMGLLLLLLIGPVYEEVLFRGIVYTFLRRECGVTLSILITTLLFAFAHGSAPVAQVAGGFIFVIAYEWSRNLWVAIALHAGANLGVLLLSIVPL